MATQSLQTRVESFVGSVTDLGALDHYLSAAAYELVNLIPEDKARAMAVHETYDTPADCQDRRVLALTRSGKPVRQVPLEISGHVQDVNSLHYATQEDPAWWWDNGQVLYFPTSGTFKMMHIPYPAVTNDSSTIPNFPLEMEELVVLGAAIRVQTARISAMRESLPDPVSAPSFTFLAVTAETVPDSAAYTIDLTSDFAQLQTYLVTEEDLEAVQGQVNEIMAKLNEWRQEADIQLNRLMANAQATNNMAQFNAAQDLQVQIREFDSRLQLYGADISRYIQETEFLQRSLISLRALYDRSLSMLLGNTNNARRDQ